MFYERVYNEIAVPTDMSEGQLARIIAGARTGDSELCMTGILLCQGGAFVSGCWSARWKL